MKSKARAGSVAEAAAFGDAILIAVPYAALPAIQQQVGGQLKGKVVIDPNNPVPSRDGELGAQAREKGAGISTAALLPGARIVRAFNSWGYGVMGREANRPAPRMAIPVAADDATALKVGMQLVADAGFDPVAAGSLAASKAFDLGSSVSGRVLTAPEMRQASATQALTFLSRFVAVRPEEVRALLWSFAYFFCLLAGYYILRPLRDEMGVAGGVRNLQWLFTATFLTMLAAVPLYGALVARLPRRRFIPLVYHFFVANLAVFWLLLTLDVERQIVARVFFVWISVFVLFAVSVFWSFMADLYSSEQGKRLYGFIAAGGSAGALAGPALTIGLAEAAGPGEPADRRGAAAGRRGALRNAPRTRRTEIGLPPRSKQRGRRRLLGRHHDGAALALYRRHHALGVAAVGGRDLPLLRAGGHRRRRLGRSRGAHANFRRRRSRRRPADHRGPVLRHRQADRALRRRPGRSRSCRSCSRRASRCSPRRRCWPW